MRHFHSLFAIPFLALLAIGCADPRNPPPTVSSPAYTETATLWEDVVSGGTEQTATFQVDRVLESATLTVAGYILPDDDIRWYESVVNDSLPSKANQITGYLIRKDELSTDIQGYLAALDNLDPHNPDDSLLIIAYWDSVHQDSALLQSFQDSLTLAAAETTAMGARRDSLVIVVDSRFALSLWLDSDTTARYPEAVYLDEQATIVSGQHFYASPTDSASGTKGRWFQLRLRQWNAADRDNVGQTIELNWLSGLTPGMHTVRARVTGSGSEITGTIVLFYREGEL